MSYLNAITDEDRYYVKRYMLLPLIIAAFERDCRFIEEQLKTPDPYVDVIKAATKKAQEELQEIKKKFFFKGLKVYEEVKTENGILAKFKCRGYSSEMELHWEFLTAQASILMRKYMGLDVTIYEDKTLPEHLRERY
ncbi:MAG: hypothetical protein ACQEXX_20065 [Bacillota bacterium]